MNREERSQIQKNYLEGHLSSPMLNVKDKERALSLFYRVVRSHTHASPLWVKGMLTELLGLLLEENCPTLFDAEEGFPIARKIRDYLDAGYGFTMRLDDFAKRFSYSKFYLEKQFQSEYGTGLIEYRNEVRMQYAKGLLESTSVSETAQTLGYQSIYSFSRAFKNHYGYAPSQVQKKG